MEQKGGSGPRPSVNVSKRNSSGKTRNQRLFQESQKIIRPSYEKRIENAMKVLYRTQNIEMAKKG